MHVNFNPSSIDRLIIELLSSVVEMWSSRSRSLRRER